MAKRHIEGTRDGLAGAGLLQPCECLCIEHVRASLWVLCRADAIERTDPVRDGNTRPDERGHRKRDQQHVPEALQPILHGTLAGVVRACIRIKD